jgi:hypothetical protein
MKVKNAVMRMFLFTLLSVNFMASVTSENLRPDVTKSYLIRFQGKDAGFCKFSVEKEQANLYLIKGETYFEVDLARGIIYHFKEKLLLSSTELNPHEYTLEVLSSPQPIKLIEAKITPNFANITYTIKAGENMVKDEKKVSIPNNNLTIIDSNVVEHGIFLINKYDFRKKDPQQIISLNVQSGQIGKLLLTNKGKETLKINTKEYYCFHISVQIENINAFEGWIDEKSHDVLKFADSQGILEVIISK